MRVKANLILLSVLLLICLFPVSGGGGSQGNQKQSGAMVPLSVEIFERGNMPASYGTPIDNRWTNYIKDKFAKPKNIDLSYVAVPRAQEVERLNVLMASKSAPDIIFNYNPAQFFNFATQGGLTDWGPYIPANAPELQKIWGEELLKYGRIQNKQYGIYAKRTELAHNVSYIRKDWLDKIGFKPQTVNVSGTNYMAMTPDELYTALQQCVAQNVSGKGANNTFAWGVFGAGPGGSTIQSPWCGVLYAFYDKNTLTEEIIATQPELLWPGHKDAVRFMNKMYNSGLIDPDFALQKDHLQFVARAANGQIGFFTGTDEFGSTETDPESNFIYLLYQNNPSAEFVGLQLLNNQTRQPSYRKRYPPTGMTIMNPSFSKATPQALQYLNWLAQENLASDVIHGVEGEHWRWANGIREPIDIEYNNNTRINPGDISIMYNGNPDPKQILAMGVAARSERIKPLYQAFFELGNENTYTPYTFNQEIASETKYSSNLQAKSAEIYTQCIMAKPQDFDSVWDRLIREYLTIGGQEIINEKTAAYRNR